MVVGLSGSNAIIGILADDSGSVLDAGVGIIGDLAISIGGSDHEHGLAVGVDSAVGARLHGDLSVGVGHCEVGRTAKNGASTGESSNPIGLGRTSGTGNVDGAQRAVVSLVCSPTQDVLTIAVSAVVNDLTNEVGVTVIGVNGLDSAVRHNQLSLILAELGVGALSVHDESVLGSIELNLINIDDQAVLIQVSDVIALGAHAGLAHLEGNAVLVVLVLLVSQSQLLAQSVLGESASDRLSLDNRLDLVVLLRIGEQDHIVFLESGGVALEAIPGAGSDGNGGLRGIDDGALSLDNHIGIGDLGLLGVDDTSVGVDHADGDGVVVAVIEYLDVGAVGNQTLVGVVVSNLQGVALRNAHVLSGNTVVEDLSGRVLLGHAQILVDVAQLNVLGVGHVSLVSIGADLVALVGPLGSGTSESVGVGGLLQLVEVLLSELDITVAALLAVDVAVVDGRAAPTLGLSGGVVGHGDVADSDGRVLLILNNVSLDHVEGIQAGLFTGDSLDAVEVADQVVSQADIQSLLGNVDGPVSAGVAFLSGIIAQSTQQHLHESVAGQGVGGLEAAVSIAGDNAGLLAVGNVASEGVVGGDVLVGSGVSHQSASGGGAKDQVADDLGGSATGQGGAGTEVTFGITGDDIHSGHHVDSFFVLDLGAVAEVLSTGRDGDQRHGHHQSQYQRKELLHGVSSF